MNERACVEELARLHNQIVETAVELETLHEDELPLWLRGALQDELYNVEALLTEPQDRAYRVLQRAGRIVAERESFDGRLRCVEDG